MVSCKTLSDFYVSRFGCKVYKIALDAGCTCPNRDGSKGSGGCIFCSENGSGDFVPERGKPIAAQVAEAKARIAKKLCGRGGNRRGAYIAYFQNFSSTYGNAKILAQTYRDALSCEGVVGLSIATRADCVGEEILGEIAKIAETHFVQIEIGLQTASEATGRLINRCFTNADYSDAVRRIKAANARIHIVTHLIFGLPNETERDMLDSVAFVARENSVPSASGREEGFCARPLLSEKMRPEDVLKNERRLFGIKITVLYVVRGTKLCELHGRGEYECLSKSEYFSLVKKAVRILGENCVVHRLTGDPPKRILVAPAWTADKKRVMNELKSFLEEETVV